MGAILLAMDTLPDANFNKRSDLIDPSILYTVRTNAVRQIVLHKPVDGIAATVIYD